MIVMSNAINVLTSFLTEANWFLAEMANILGMRGWLYSFMTYDIKPILRHTHSCSSLKVHFTPPPILRPVGFCLYLFVAFGITLIPISLFVRDDFQQVSMSMCPLPLYDIQYYTHPFWHLALHPP